MELTKEKAIKEHRKMWRWLAEHPDKNKSDYFELMGIDDSDLYNRCFLCTYAEAEMERQQVDDYVGCNYCPLDWGDKGCNGTDYSLYDAWVFYGDTSDDDRCAEAARQIAELPERIVK